MKTANAIASAFGYMTQAEVNFLKELAGKTPKHGVIVNIGAGSGTSGLALAEARPEAVRFTVDISLGGPYGGMQNEINAFEGSGLPLPIQIVGDSKVVGGLWTLPIDLLFIDGDHSKAGITGDIDQWFYHLAVGGFVVYHDYGSPNWTDVRVVVDEKMSIATRIGLVDSMIAFQV